MPRGIVLGITHRHAIVLTRDGDFCRIPRQKGMTVGAEVIWQARRSWWTRAWYKVAAAAVAAVVFLGIGIFGAGRMLSPERAYAYVSLDMNPSVSLTVDQHTRVMEASPLNAAGRTLLAQVHVRGAQLEQALDDLVETSVNRKMLPVGDTILISAAPAGSDDDVDDIRTVALSAVESAIRENPQAEQLHPAVYALDVSRTVWKTAHQAQLSPGKLAAYLAAHKEGMPVSLEDLQGPTLSDVLAAAKASKSLLTTLENGDDAAIASLLRSLTGEEKTENASPSTSHDIGTANASGSAVNGRDRATTKSSTSSMAPDAAHKGKKGTQKPSRDQSAQAGAVPSGTAKSGGGAGAADSKAFSDGQSIRIQVGDVTFWVQVNADSAATDAGTPSGLPGAASVARSGTQTEASGGTSRSQGGTQTDEKGTPVQNQAWHSSHGDPSHATASHQPHEPHHPLPAAASPSVHSGHSAPGHSVGSTHGRTDNGTDVHSNRLPSASASGGTQGAHGHSLQPPLTRDRFRQHGGAQTGPHGGGDKPHATESDRGGSKTTK
ncbi:anti-sigma factor domain-containing protein [Alicyclobacillus herbarius]|uniref:anti-sigma factor domain-containing protein n=1 Tax=Alicyclobacillus herbarius TaxID=122960 RepID=UPI0003FB707E|nr:anti-sigma factor domain-containing protein [Alicyclobacillus herbarius]